MACQKYANKVGMIHESKGQHIGKAYIFFTLQCKQFHRAKSVPIHAVINAMHLSVGSYRSSVVLL